MGFLKGVELSLLLIHYNVFYILKIDGVFFHIVSTKSKIYLPHFCITDNTERNEMTKDHQNKALGPTMNDGRNDMISNKSGKESTVNLTGEKEKTEKYSKSHKSFEVTEEMKNKMIENFDQILLEVKKNDKTSSEDLVQCGLWDFAGQKDYYVTHQTFLTSNAIYLIVTDLKEDIKTRTQDEDFNYIGIGGNKCLKVLTKQILNTNETKGSSSIFNKHWHY